MLPSINAPCLGVTSLEREEIRGCYRQGEGRAGVSHLPPEQVAAEACGTSHYQRARIGTRASPPKPRAKHPSARPAVVRPEVSTGDDRQEEHSATSPLASCSGLSGRCLLQ